MALTAALHARKKTFDVRWKVQSAVVRLVYRLDEIPDLSLAKYRSLGEVGVEGAIEKHNAFLRQWQRISMVCNLSVSMYFRYDPTKGEGNRERAYVSFAFGEPQLGEKIVRMMGASPLSEFFRLKRCEYNELADWTNRGFRSYAELKKIERKRQTDDDSRLQLYTVEGWESMEDARLYDMVRMMAALNEAAVFCVTVRGVDAFNQVATALEKPISLLRKRVHGDSSDISLKDVKQYKPRDYTSSETLKVYEELLTATVESPCFQARVSVYADDDLSALVLLNAACSEAIEEGNCRIVTHSGDTFRPIDIQEDRSYLNDTVPERLAFWPSLYTLEEIAPFFRLPTLYDGEYIDMNKESSPKLEHAGLIMGRDTQGHDVYITNNGLMKHAFVCGVPGSGKTNTMLHLACSLRSNEEKVFGTVRKRPIPFLVFEPAKREYRELANYDIPELVVFSPNANTRFPLQINPFEFPLGLTVSEHITKLKQVFEGAFPMEPPAPFILDQSIEAAYTRHGWRQDDINMGDKQYPTISELYMEFERQIETTNYDGEIKGNIRSVLEMRIGSLIRREKKAMFDVRRSILKPEEWFTRPIVIELEALGKEVANFTTLLICTLIRETLKVNPMDGIEVREAEAELGRDREVYKPLRHVIFIEEAHNLIAPQTQMENYDESNPKIAATECIVDMLKEVRALREGVIIADQLPTAMADDVIKNTNFKFVHRLTSTDDRSLVGSTMSANELQLEQVATYMPGQALMTYEGLLRPFEMRVCNLESHGETPSDDELYEILRLKPGMRDIFRRYEARAWNEFQSRIGGVLAIEQTQCNALDSYDFSGKSALQIEDYLRQCTERYQALVALREQRLIEFETMTCEYFKDAEPDAVLKAIRAIGETYRKKLYQQIHKRSE